MILELGITHRARLDETLIPVNPGLLLEEALESAERDGKFLCRATFPSICGYVAVFFEILEGERVEARLGVGLPELITSSYQ